MTALRILAVDDEPLALRRIELLLGRIPGAELAGAARDLEEALTLLGSARPDVLLLDVKLAGASGFDLIDRLPEGAAPLVIFATAFDHFAARAFEVSAVDYLVKPIERERLRAAIGKARRALDAADAAARLAELKLVVGALREERRPDAEPRYEREIWAERMGEFHPVKTDAIDWIEAERDYVRLHTASHAYLLRETTANMAARLDPEQFIRVRRSALVRRDAMQAIRLAGYGNYRIQLENGHELRVGRTYLKAVRALIGRRRAD